MSIKKLEEISAYKLAGLTMDLQDKLRQGVVLPQELEAFLNMPMAERRRAFGLPIPETFRVGEVFKSGIDTGILQKHEGRIPWMLKQAKGKKLTVPYFMDNLKEYVLSKDMHNRAIKTKTTSLPMNENLFWIVLYLLVIKPDLGKQLLGYQLESGLYIFHAIVAGKTLAPSVMFSKGAGYFLDAEDFDSFMPWSKSAIFLYFSTKK
jgi:hypothetical protein